MNELALFAGAGGGILGGKLLGWTTICAVELNPYCRDVLMARQNEGNLQPFPIWDDVCTFDGTKWKGLVDIVSGGFPCQDISVAGEGTGIEGERSGLWGQQARIIGEVRPRFAYVENSPALTIRGGVRVVADLASMGYGCRWGIMGAHHAGAPHFRDRIWILADSQCMRWRKLTYAPQARRESLCEALGPESPPFIGPGSETSGSWSNPNSEGVNRKTRDCLVPGGNGSAQESVGGLVGNSLAQGRQSTNRWFEREPGLARLVDGVANRTKRLTASGNGQVPAVVRLAWDTLKP
jgi:DNA (cytosine-5)-methyltransferase 1